MPVPSKEPPTANEQKRLEEKVALWKSSKIGRELVRKVGKKTVRGHQLQPPAAAHTARIHLHFYAGRDVRRQSCVASSAACTPDPAATAAVRTAAQCCSGAAAQPSEEPFQPNRRLPSTGGGYCVERGAGRLQGSAGQGHQHVPRALGRGGVQPQQEALAQGETLVQIHVLDGKHRPLRLVNSRHAGFR